jgi:hypothetical protein
VNHKKELGGQGDSEAGCTGSSKKEKNTMLKKLSTTRRIKIRYKKAIIAP